MHGLGVTPKASPICCHDQPFSRANVTWFAGGFLGQAMERQRGAKPERRVIRREIHAEFLDVHVCQSNLTDMDMSV